MPGVEAEREHVDERVVAVTDAVRYWPREKPGQFKFGSFLGRMVVTDTHLLFLSKGGPGWDESIGRLALGGVVGLVIGVATAGHSTKDLDLSALSNKGSLRIPLASVVSCDTQRRFVLAFTTLKYRDEEGADKTCAVVSERPFGKGALEELTRVINDARSSAER